MGGCLGGTLDCCVSKHRTSVAVDKLFQNSSRPCGRYTAIRIIDARSELFEPALGVLARAFCGTESTKPDSCYGWVYSGSLEGLFAPLAAPPSKTRLKWFVWFCRMTMLWGLNRGGIYGLVNEDRVVVATVVTAPPGSPPALRTIEEIALFAKCGMPPSNDSDGDAVTKRCMALETSLALLHKSIAPNQKDLHVAMLGSDPERQGQGCGSALVGLVQELADADGVATYLETCGMGSEGFYAKKGGFRVVGRAIIEHGSKTLDVNGGVAAMMRPARRQDV